MQEKKPWQQLRIRHPGASEKKSGLELTQCQGCGKNLRVDSRGIAAKFAGFQTPEGRTYN